MPDSKLCVTVAGATTAELRQRRDRVGDADLIELRLDLARDPDATGALAGRGPTPVIVTCRSAAEGGGFEGSEEERKAILRTAAHLGADYIDVEWSAGFQDLIDERQGRGVIVSMHDFAGVPGDLEARAAGMRTTGAEVVKVAVMSSRLSDAARLRRLAADVPGATVVIAMGEAGLPTRVLPSRVGSAWTYAGDAVAPGQIPPAQLVERSSFRRVTDATALYGVVGRPIAHSLSPAMHNAAFRALGIDAVYLPLAAADFGDFLQFASEFSVRGASVTAPFKLDAFTHAREHDALSDRTRAANTLKRCGDHWAARNTDVAGFLRPFERRGIALRGVRATILGAGGAARAAAEGLGSSGADVTICSRRTTWPPAAGSWDLLVNATPVGTAPAIDDSPLPGGPFGGRLVYDLVYNPSNTRLLREAQAAGCQTIDGLEMLIAQAQAQFEWWTGSQADEAIMRKAAFDALRHRQTPAPTLKTS